MRTVHRVLAFVICGLVAVQASSHAWASSGLSKFLAEGGDINAVFSGAGQPPVEFIGIIVHGMNGMYVIPTVALVLLIVSFFAKVHRGVMWAGVILGLVVLQVTLGLLAREASISALFHGINALLLFGVALWTGIRAKAPGSAVQAEPRAAVGAG